MFICKRARLSGGPHHPWRRSMATTTTRKNGRANLQVFVKEHIADAQKRFAQFEGEAQKVFETLVGRARESRKELGGFVQDRLDNLKDLPLLGRANASLSEVQKRLTTVQTKVIESVGMASQAQVNQINRELQRLSKKLDGLMGKKGSGRGETQDN
jgi:ElaB/YqjD/DUF883 family membrane-anchored ribosome-binding protein